MMCHDMIWYWYDTLGYETACMQTNKQASKQASKHTHTHAHNIHTCMHACIHTYMHACMHIYIYNYIYIYACIDMHACIYICMYRHACIYIYMHVYTCMHITRYELMHHDIKCYSVVWCVMFWYELQPKFRLMESSIRAVFFLEIELGLGKR